MNNNWRIFVHCSALVASLAPFGCSTQPMQDAEIAATETADTARYQAEPIEYVIVPGDELEIKFFYNPELNETITVRPDGRISLLLVDEVEAASLTPAELDGRLTELYSEDLKDPRLTVIIRSFTSQRVFVAGEVNNGGMMPLSAGMTAVQAVFASGGLRESADPSSAFVIRRGPQNTPEPIAVDISTVLKGDGQISDVLLQPQDIVFVPKSGIARANRFMAQYVRDLFLFNGWSYLWTYERNPVTLQ